MEDCEEQLFLPKSRRLSLLTLKKNQPNYVLPLDSFSHCEEQQRMQATAAEPVFDDIAIRGTVARPTVGRQILLLPLFKETNI